MPGSACLRTTATGLTPPQRNNQILYHGVLAPRAAWRALVVQFGTIGPAVTEGDDDVEEHPDADRGRGPNYP